MLKTFKEVQEIIKPNQIWESETAKLYLNKEFDLAIELKNNESVSGFVISNEAKYKLRRERVTFFEAFKAFEEGKIIESCKSGWAYQEVNSEYYVKSPHSRYWKPWDDETFDILEVKREWFIGE